MIDAQVGHVTAVSCPALLFWANDVYAISHQGEDCRQFDKKASGEGILQVSGRLASQICCPCDGRCDRQTSEEKLHRLVRVRRMIMETLLR